MDYEATKLTILETPFLYELRNLALDLLNEVQLLKNCQPFHETQCECCGKTFTVGGGNYRRKDKRHCSTVCRNKMFRRRKQAQLGAS